MAYGQSEVKGLGKVFGGEATQRAANLCHANPKLFPGIDITMLAEANRTIQSMGGLATIDIEKLFAGLHFFADTMVIQVHLDAKKNPRGSSELFSWTLTQGASEDFAAAFPGISRSIKKTGCKIGDQVEFTITIKTQDLAASAAFELAVSIKNGTFKVGSSVVSLVDCDWTVNIPAHIKAGWAEDLEDIWSGYERLKVIEGTQKSVGMRCPQWRGTGKYFKLYNKLDFMLSVGTNILERGGSQLINLVQSTHSNIAAAMLDKDFQEKGFGRAELRYDAKHLPSSLGAIKEELGSLVTQAAEQCAIKRKTDDMVKGFLAAGHRQLVYLEEQKGSKYKVVLVRWINHITRHFNSQSCSSAGIKTLETLEEARLLAYQWAMGQYPVIVVEVGLDGVLGDSWMLPPTGRQAAIVWDSRKDPQRSRVGKGRGKSFSEVGLPSFWMDSPLKQNPCAVGDFSAWWDKKREVGVKVGLSKAAVQAKAREWTKVQNRKARQAVAQMVADCGSGIGAKVSFDKVKGDKTALLVVKVGKNSFKDEVFLASDGNSYPTSKWMLAKGMGGQVASKENPLVFFRGKAGKKTVSGANTYPDAMLVPFNRGYCKQYFPELEGYFYTSDDYQLYSGIVV